MLRWLMGDEQFFSAIKNYLERFAYGNAVTKDFTQVMQEHSKRDLGWFFQQWIYQPGHPDLNLSWYFEETPRNDYVVHLKVVQKQKENTYILPSEIMIETASTSTFLLDTILIDQREMKFTFKVTDPPVSLAFDPHHWLLKENNMISIPSKDHFMIGKVALGNSHPNPFLPSIEGSPVAIHFQITEQFSLRPVSLAIYNIIGQKVKVLTEGAKVSGEYTCHWDGRDVDGNLVPSGIYFYRLQSEDQCSTKKMVLMQR
jgi:hypothetical protein